MNASTRAPGGGIPPTRYFVFMGVSGVGKTSVARGAGDALDAAFVEADDSHPPENVAAMAAGHGLTDAQRWPWLKAVCKAALEAGADGRTVMIACSALKTSYRDLIRKRLPHPVFLHLTGPKEVIRARMEKRKSHYMAASMLDGQLADLEVPDGEPDCFAVDVTPPLETVVAQAVAVCRRHLAQESGA